MSKPVILLAAGEASSDLAALLDRVAGRDRAAFKALYEATSPRLYALVLRVVGRTLGVWIGPAILLLIGLSVMFNTVRRHLGEAED